MTATKTLAMKAGALDYILTEAVQTQRRAPGLRPFAGDADAAPENAERERLVYNHTADLEVVNRDLETFRESAQQMGQTIEDMTALARVSRSNIQRVSETTALASIARWPADARAGMGAAISIMEHPQSHG